MTKTYVDLTNEIDFVPGDDIVDDTKSVDQEASICDEL